MSNVRRYRGIWILLLSVAAGMALTAYLYQRLGDRQRQQAQAARSHHGDQTVWVAIKDIPPGTTITADLLLEHTQPARFTPDDALRTSEEAIDRVTRSQLFHGDIVREGRLAPEGAGVGLQAIIPSNMRAIQIDMPPDRAVSGLIAPGHRVDLITVCSTAEGNKVETILQDVHVLAVKGRFNDEKRKKNSRRHKPTLTLAVKPQDALLVRQTSHSCKLSVALRSELEPAALTSLGDDPSAP